MIFKEQKKRTLHLEYVSKGEVIREIGKAPMRQSLVDHGITLDLI